MPGRCLSEFQVFIFLPVVFLCSGCAHLHTAAVTDRSVLHQVSGNSGAVVRANDNGDCMGCAEGCAGCSSQIEYGRPSKLVDGLGWFLGIPEKILLWDRRAKNHNVSQRTASVVHQYVQSEGLRDVKVRINQYAPAGEWRRLARNREVSPLWRYSIGALSTVGYTLLPGRLFGSDNYNPFTNTLSIYSDIPTVAVHEAAYAKDNADRTYRGTYGFAQYVPGINIWHETRATAMSHTWLRGTQSSALVHESNRILPPLYGMRVGGSVGQFFPAGETALTVAGAVTGHAVGYRLNRRHNAGVAAESRSTSGIVPAAYAEFR